MQSGAMNHSPRIALATGLLLAASLPSAWSREIDAAARVDTQAAQIESTALKIWNLAEVGYQEVESLRLLQEQLRRAGFSLEAGVAGMPTAFVARYALDGYDPNGLGPCHLLLRDLRAERGDSLVMWRCCLDLGSIRVDPVSGHGMTRQQYCTHRFDSAARRPLSSPPH